MKLSNNFHLDEFLKSKTADRLNIPMNPPVEVVVALTALTVCLLQPVRESVNKRMQVTSGWRPSPVNEAVGGSSTSQHLLGEAADCVVPGLTPQALAHKVLDLNVDFGQLIVYPDKGTVHLSYCRLGNNKREVKTRTANGFAKGILEG